MALSRGIFIVAAKRTPFGSFGGSLSQHSPTDLCVVAGKAALAAGNVSPQIIDSTVVAQVATALMGCYYIGRHVSLRCGVPIDRPALTINRLCGSGLQVLVNATLDILTEDAEIGLAGGTETTSNVPFFIRSGRFGIKLGERPVMEDPLFEGLTDRYISMPNAYTAETLGVAYDVTREDCDRLAIQSQQRWKAAKDIGAFEEEITPVECKILEDTYVVDTDENPRETSMEVLSKLPPHFGKDGLISGGNAASLGDGAGAIVMASEEACTKHNLTPLARLVAYQVVGCDPLTRGLGAVIATSTRKVLEKAKFNLDDIDICEVQETFAAQAIAICRELRVDPAKTNTNGGAIAIGNPLSASGVRIATHLTHELRRRNLRYGLGAQPIGGGQGIAVILENVK